MEAWSLLPAGRRQDEFRTEAGRGQEQLLLLVDGGTDSTSEPEQKVLLPSQVDEEEDVWREQLPQTACVCVCVQAVDRGLVFEVSYSASIRDTTMRRYTIANANALMDTCKGKVLPVCSGQTSCLLYPMFVCL